MRWRQGLQYGDVPTTAATLAVDYPHLLPYLYDVAQGYSEGAERFEQAYLEVSGVSKAVFTKNVKNIRFRPSSLPRRDAFIASLASAKEQAAKAMR